MRIVFMGTPEFSVPVLEELCARGHNIVAVYSQPPRPAGRGQKERKSPVQIAAESRSIPVFTPRSLKKNEHHERFISHNAQLAIVVAYGLILPLPILAGPQFGCLNLHASPLPRWRGAAPIQRAIMAGDKMTAVSIMQMEKGLDTGPVALRKAVPITSEMTAGELHDILMHVGAVLMRDAVEQIENEGLEFVTQALTGVTYAKKIEKSETQIDWTRSANQVHNHIRGLSPHPGAWCEFVLRGKPVRVKILLAELAEAEGVPGTILSNDLIVACGRGAIRLKSVQRAGGSRVSAQEFARGTDRLIGQKISGAGQHAQI